ncbi:hypothetical protein FB45DRAFT_199457 [Roridomyces roridus]|uniref:RING-CH-type domain-containing protein n=1 Tax=Roridomyces roridus TaxID=1738132 RepID=A0AAD7G055_9AGAR|nr:hypothetical protein FB45DRAFT_199457 [Roridomyces roridus]
MSDRPPTLDDLRVKLCYICRDEETDAAAPPRAWVHPCTCTVSPILISLNPAYSTKLVAHEACLLAWVKASEGTGREARARQCPQCKFQYELESKNPAILRFLRATDKYLSKSDILFYFAGFYFIVRAVYRGHLGYGAWALRKYVGDEMFDLLLTNDRENWPLIAKFNMCLVPMGLVLNRIGLPYTLSALLATWPTFAFQADDSRTDSTFPWPPSPFVFGFVILPICQQVYSHYFAKFKHWVLDTQPAPLRPRNNPGIRGWLQRFLDDMERAADARAARRGVNAENGNANEEGAIVTLDLRKAARIVGGALLLPLIANVMGGFLHRLSTHVGLLHRFLAVRPAWKGFLPPPPLKRYTAKDLWQRAAATEPNVGRTLKLVLRAVWGDIRKFDQCDPVWWRNSVGLGLFAVVRTGSPARPCIANQRCSQAKDLLQLLHLWLSQRELATRRVKNRDFSAVDPSELDLLPR